MFQINTTTDFPNALLQTVEHRQRWVQKKNATTGETEFENTGELMYDDEGYAICRAFLSVLIPGSRRPVELQVDLRVPKADVEGTLSRMNGLQHQFVAPRNLRVALSASGHARFTADDIAASGQAFAKGDAK